MERDAQKRIALAQLNPKSKNPSLDVRYAASTLIWRAYHDLGDGNYLPRGIQVNLGTTTPTEPHLPGTLFSTIQNHGDLSVSPTEIQLASSGYWHADIMIKSMPLPPPINISVGSQLPSHGLALDDPTLVNKEKIRTTNKYGVPYYIIPIEYTFTYQQS